MAVASICNLAQLHLISVALSGQQNPCRITRKVETDEICTMYIEEFILVDIWIHCCASWN